MNVLIAADASLHGEAVLRVAARRDWPRGTALRVVNVAEIPTYSDPKTVKLLQKRGQSTLTADERARAQKWLDEAAAGLRGKNVAVSTALREGLADDEILEEAASWGADLIMVGTHSKRRLSRFLLGSVAQRVSALASCSVEIVREKK